MVFYSVVFKLIRLADSTELICLVNVIYTNDYDCYVGLMFHRQLG